MKLDTNHSVTHVTPERSTLDPATNASTVMTIPGQGETPDDERCHERNWWGWRTQHVATITERLAAARYAAPDGHRKRLVHASISPPPGETERLADVYTATETAAELAMQQNIRGGALVFHGYRVSEDGKNAYETAVANGEWGPKYTDRNVSDDILNSLPQDRDIDGGIWWWLRKESSDWRSMVEWSPHFHCLGLVDDMYENKPDELDGWVCKRMRSLSPFTLYENDGYKDMVCTAKHLYTHATFAPGDADNTTTSWFANTDYPETEYLTDNNALNLTVQKPTASNIEQTTATFL